MMKIMLIALLMMFSAILQAQDSLTSQRDRLVTREIIFQGEQQINAMYDGSTAWAQIGNFNLPNKLLVSGGGSGNYKWRLHMFYSVEGEGAEVSVQARIVINSVQNPTFTLSWDKGRGGMRSAYTNWLRPDFLGLNSSSSFPVYINLKKSNQSKQSSIRLQLVELEVWEEVEGFFGDGETDLVPKQAVAPVLKPSSTQTTVRVPPSQSDTKSDHPREAALTAGMAFLKAAAVGDMETIKALTSKKVVSLSDLEMLPLSRLPMMKLDGKKSFRDYTDNYDPTIFSYAEFEGLFDDWESHFVGDWQVSAKSYLFIGNHLKPWGNDLFSNQPLVFVLEEENGAMKVKAFP